MITSRPKGFCESWTPKLQLFISGSQSQSATRYRIFLLLLTRQIYMLCARFIIFECHLFWIFHLFYWVWCSASSFACEYALITILELVDLFSLQAHIYVKIYSAWSDSRHAFWISDPHVPLVPLHARWNMNFPRDTRGRGRHGEEQYMKHIRDAKIELRRRVTVQFVLFPEIQFLTR